MLTGGRAAALPTADDLALPADELRKQLKILVIDEHRRGDACRRRRSGFFRLVRTVVLLRLRAEGDRRLRRCCYRKLIARFNFPRLIGDDPELLVSYAVYRNPRQGSKRPAGVSARFLVACGNHSSIGRLEALSLSNVRPGFVFGRVPEPPLAGSFPLSYSARCLGQGRIGPVDAR